MHKLSLVVTSKWNKIVQKSTVRSTIKKETKIFDYLSIFFDNKTDNNVVRGNTCMEKVHVYQTIFQSTLDTSLRNLQYKIVMYSELDSFGSSTVSGHL